MTLRATRSSCSNPLDRNRLEDHGLHSTAQDTMRLRAVLLDMDGTMVEQATTTKFLNHACHKLGLPVSAAQIDQAYETVARSWITDSTDFRLQTRGAFVQLNCEFLAALGVKRDLDRLARRMQRMWDRYPDEIEERIYPDVKGALRTLRRKGFTLGVVSHRHRALSLASLKRHRLQQDFACVISPQVAGAPRGKLDLQMWQCALNEVNAAPAEVLHVDDDYEIGVRGAIQAGIRAVLIDRTGTSPPRRDCEVVHDFDDLLKLVGL